MHTDGPQVLHDLKNLGRREDRTDVRRRGGDERGDCMDAEKQRAAIRQQRKSPSNVPSGPRLKLEKATALAPFEEAGLGLPG